MQTALALALIAQTLTAQQVLAKCEAAYRGAKTLNVRVSTTVQGRKATAEIFIKKPDQLRVSGTSMFGSKYDLVCSGASRWLLNAGQWEPVPNLEQGIASITGISANTGTHVPALAFHTSWGTLLSAGATNMKKEMLGGRSVYHLRQAQPVDQDAWIDAKTYMLVQTRTAISGYTFLLDYTTVAVNKPIAASKFVRPK